MPYKGKIFDAHTHVMEGASGAAKLLKTEREYGYVGFNALGASAWGGAAQDAQCLAVKRYEGCYAFGSMNHAEGDFRSQCERLFRMGADGFKMIEGKPDVYRSIGRPLNSSYYEEVYAFAEEKGLPILAHVGDPPEFWAPEKAPAFAVENGWTYAGGEYPSLEELFAQVEDIAARHPALKLILAHFFFHSHRLENAADFLDRHPSICFDICPGTEMYENFSRDPKRSREFFLRYQDRLIFGTDNWDTEAPGEIYDKNEINRMIHSFLQTEGEFPVWDHEMRGIGLPQEALEKIYHGNFERLAGERPREWDEGLLAEYCRELLAAPERFGADEADAARLEDVLHELELHG